ncbi:hypothetical protein IQ255_24215 [Pleurocapsales cyanobacterium LEGE 10410]|nr:hypothetical protein [Pleurocapsales cyanobacterium LEGE 10410]
MVALRTGLKGDARQPSPLIDIGLSKIEFYMLNSIYKAKCRGLQLRQEARQEIR